MNVQIITPDYASSPGTTHNIYNGSDNPQFIYLDGRGIPEIERITRKHQGQYGESDYGFKIHPRKMSLRFAVDADNFSSTMDDYRDLLYRIFYPYQDPLKLRITRDDGAVRQIDCFTQGTVDIRDSENFGMNVKEVSVELLAPNPIWYNPTAKQLDYTLPAGTGSGSAGPTFDYTGNWWEFPTIRVYGQITNLYIRFSETVLGSFFNRQIQIYDVPTSRNYLISLADSTKTVYDDLGVNKTSQVSDFLDSFLECGIPPIYHSFNLDATPTMTLIWTSKSNSARVVMDYYERFLGI